MTIPDPPWKQKTRPCPFYSQGRCLFSDSCNFLHDVKIRVKQPHITITDSTPDVTVSVSQSSSATASPASPHLNVRSPPRSPRLSSLLLALGDVIQPDEDEQVEEDSTSLAYAVDIQQDPVVPERGSETEAKESHELASSSPESAAVQQMADEPQDFEANSAECDVEREPSDLLSPIDVKSLGQLEAPAHREDSIDSGYGDTWTGPSPFALSPPRPQSSRRYSTLSLLSSPFGSPVRALSPKFGPSASSAWPSSPLFSPVLSKAGSRPSSLRLSQISDDLDSPTDYHRRLSTGSPSATSAEIEDEGGIDEDLTIRRSPLAVLHDNSVQQQVEATVVPTQDEVGLDAREDLTSPKLLIAVSHGGGHQPAKSTVVPGMGKDLTSRKSSIASWHDDPVQQPVEATVVPTKVGTDEDLTSPKLPAAVSHGGPVRQPREATIVPTTDKVRFDEDLTSSKSPITPLYDDFVRRPVATTVVPTKYEAEIGEHLTSHKSPVALWYDDSMQQPVEATVVPAKKPLYEPDVSPMDQRHQATIVPGSPASTASLEELYALDPRDSAIEALAEVSAPATAAGPIEEDTSALYTSYYSEAVYTNSPRNVELSANIPAAASSTSRLSIVPTPFMKRSSSYESAPPEFITGSSKDAYHSPIPGQLYEQQLPSQAASPLLSYAMPSARTSPTLSRQSSFSDKGMAPPSSRPPSTKVPFGFRHTVVARTRESLASRPGSAPPIRHRPPALVGLASGRSQSLNDEGQRSPEESLSSSRSSSRLRPLRLSMLLNSSSSSLTSPTSSNVLPVVTASSFTDYSRASSPSVKSEYSLSNNPLLSSARSDRIPHRTNSINISTTAHSLEASRQSLSLPLSAPITHHTQPPWNSTASSPKFAPARLLHLSRPSSRLSEPLEPPIREEESVAFDTPDSDVDEEDPTGQTDDPDLTINVRQVASRSASPQALLPSRPMSVLSMAYEPIHAIATPRPTLLFAIASDNVDEVRRVLEAGEVSPNDDVGPQSALAFALTSNQLRHKTEIVKLLLAHGADPSVLNAIAGHSRESSNSTAGESMQGGDGMRPTVVDPIEAADPATRYYITRAQAPQTRRASALIHRSFFRPLTKVRYEMVGQDRALEQLFRVLSMPTMAPIVVLLCGPSGHGKSLLARRFGSLLDVPTHTVNMTTLRSTHDIWRSYSMSPYEEPTSLTLADFLMENEGKRCVVVLDEIEKTENEKVLSSLLMPWELGRCSFEAGHRHVNVSKVIWLGTSNIGHDLVFEHQSSRPSPTEPVTRDEYIDLMGILRPVVSDRLGPSLLSRVTTVLPFVPFTADEKLAIATEALFSLVDDAAMKLPAATVEKLVHDSLHSYVPAEGARSLYRAVSNQLLEIL